MTAIRRFFDTIRRSLTDPTLYKDAAAQPLGKAYGYLFWILFLIGLVSVVLGALRLTAALPTIRTVSSEIQRELPNLYPEELELTLSGGILSTNVEEPYSIDLPARWKRALQDSNEVPQRVPEHFVTFDTKATMEDYVARDTVVLFTQKGFVVPDRQSSTEDRPINEGAIQFQPYGNTGTGTVTMTRKEWDTFTAFVLPFAAQLPNFAIAFAVLCVFIGPFLVAGIGWVFYVAYLTILALLLKLLAMITGKPWSYGSLYRMSMYGLTPTLLIGFVFGQIGLHYPFLGTVIFLVWMGMMLQKLTPPAAVQKA